MSKIRKAGLVTIAFGLAFATLNANSAETTKDSASVQPDDAVRSVLMGLESAVSKKNVESAAALFAEDAHTIDQGGEEIRGRKALRERFDRLKDASAPAVGIHPQSITFPADTVALVVGEVSRKHGQEDLPASRFSMMLVKRENNWLITELQETTMQSAQTESHLQDLDWLIGQWSASMPDASAQLNFDWSPDKKFITSKCTLNKNGKAQVDSQVIGWDPQHNTIISWHFDSNGGFGSGTWSKQPADNKWTVHVAGVGADGSNSVASNVFTLKSSDEFVWQSVHRTLDGDTVRDTEPITVHRVKR
jgi:uncharacterized protein (TIGR02246 family)